MNEAANICCFRASWDRIIGLEFRNPFSNVGIKMTKLKLKVYIYVNIERKFKFQIIKLIQRKEGCINVSKNDYI